MIWSPVGTTLSIQTRSVRCIPCRSSSRTKYILLRMSVCDDVPVGSGGIRFCRSLVLKTQCRLLFTKECAMWLHPSGVVLTGLGLFVLLYPALEVLGCSAPPRWGWGILQRGFRRPTPQRAKPVSSHLFRLKYVLILSWFLAHHGHGADALAGGRKNCVCDRRRQSYDGGFSRAGRGQVLAV